MASSENNSDEGGRSVVTIDVPKTNPDCISGNVADYDHMIQIEYLKEKYRDVISQLKTVSNEKERYVLKCPPPKEKLQSGACSIMHTIQEFLTCNSMYFKCELQFLVV